MASLVRLLHVAQAAREVSALELDVFLEAAHARHLEAGLSGALLILHQGRRPSAFVHWIEGTEEAVARYAEGLAAEPFLSQARTASRATVPARAYQGWRFSWAYATPEEITRGIARIERIGMVA